MPFWVPIVGAVIGGVVAIAIFILSGRRERAQSKHEAIAKFRAAFAEEFTQFGKMDAHYLMKSKEVQVKHDVAIHDFRRIINSKDLAEFDATVEKFNRCRENLVPATLAVLASLNSGKPVDDSDDESMKVALNELLAFADKS